MSLKTIDQEPPAAAQAACEKLMPPLNAIALIFGSDGTIGLSSFSPVHATTDIHSSILGSGLPYDLDCFYTGQGARLHFVFLEQESLTPETGALIDQDGGQVMVAPLGGWYLRASTGVDSVEVDLVTDAAYYMEPQIYYCPPMGGPTETEFVKMLAGELAQPPT